MLSFLKLARNEFIPASAKNTVCLREDNWDDFGFKTIFAIIVFDEMGKQHDLGVTKIGYLGQAEGWTSEKIDKKFQSLPEDFFSVGQDPDFYEKINNSLTNDFKSALLTGLGDIVFDRDRLTIAENDGLTSTYSVFHTSLLRNVSLSVVTSQFKRILEGGALLTEYDFCYEKNGDEDNSGVRLEFNVDPETRPTSNIHALIGRNGVGKTTILNNMVNAIISTENTEPSKVGYFTQAGIFGPVGLEDDYFRGVISVSFSAFDPFIPPVQQASRSIDYNYIGLKTINQPIYNGEDRLKTKDELCQELVESLKVCLAVSGKRERWLNAVHKLDSDANFSDMDLGALIEVEADDATEDRSVLGEAAIRKFTSLSSGHAIVLLILTRLVECLEEKTLVLIDEPESHLHPPLLSAFTRALSDMLLNRNGVAIVATHSPVVLQEIPKSCVSILRRNRTVSTVTRPKSETFGENVGILTREVFGLEVSKSGFYDLLARSVKEEKSYDEILRDYQDQIGYEGQAILRALIANKEV